LLSQKHLILHDGDDLDLVLTPRQSDPRSCFLYSLQIFVYDLVLTLDALVSQLYSHRCKAHHSSIFLCIGILWVTTQTQLFLITPPQKSLAGEWPKRFREINPSNNKLCVIVVVVSPCFWQIRCPVDRSWCAQRCCDGAATESLLRRRRCCDGYAQTSSVARVAAASAASRTRRAE